MAQISIVVKYVLNKNERDTVGNIRAKIDTSARVDDFLDAVKETVPELGKTKMQLYLPVDPSESLENFGVKPGDMILIVAKSIAIFTPENGPEK